jgi:cytochrome bd-type quinol oxidase subunit 1
VCGALAVVSLALSVFTHPLFFLLSVGFGLVCLLSAWRIFNREKPDGDLGVGFENKEPA